jgi:hypothetical protein
MIRKISAFMLCRSYLSKDFDGIAIGWITEGLTMDKPLLWPKPDAITLQCISCRTTEVAPWIEAMRVPDPPRCPKCGTIMVAIKGHWRNAL